MANITIIELARYAGKVIFTSKTGMGGVTIIDGLEEVTCVLTEDLPDVRTFTAEGTISGDLARALGRCG